MQRTPQSEVSMSSSVERLAVLNFERDNPATADMAGRSEQRRSFDLNHRRIPTQPRRASGRQGYRAGTVVDDRGVASVALWHLGVMHRKPARERGLLSSRDRRDDRGLRGAEECLHACAPNCTSSCHDRHGCQTGTAHGAELWPIEAMCGWWTACRVIARLMRRRPDLPTAAPPDIAVDPRLSSFADISKTKEAGALACDSRSPGTDAVDPCGHDGKTMLAPSRSPAPADANGGLRSDGVR